MRIIGVIPARYKSSRFEGKPLADIHGKPMIWWVYQQAKKVEELDEVYVATDDSRIQKTCNDLDINVVMTSEDNPTHINRISEFSNYVSADAYVVICGDEPLIEPTAISAVIPKKSIDQNKEYVGNLVRDFSEPSEVVDPGNIKSVLNKQSETVMLSRSPIPFPYKTIIFKYKKLIGIECYNKKALDFFQSSEKGELESIEDVTLQRFLENHIPIKSKMIDSESLSVDTPRDLEKVIAIMDSRN